MTIDGAQQYSCLIIPPFDAVSGNLPAGIHDATWSELVARYGYTTHRLTLLAGLKAGLDALKAAGCRRAYINGSFVTFKVAPGDFDVCWELAGVQVSLLDPVLLSFSNLRAAQKAKYLGELFIAEANTDAIGTRYLDFFQLDRNGNKKGIIAISLVLQRDVDLRLTSHGKERRLKSCGGGLLRHFSVRCVPCDFSRRLVLTL